MVSGEGTMFSCLLWPRPPFQLRSPGRCHDATSTTSVPSDEPEHIRTFAAAIERARAFLSNLRGIACIVLLGVPVFLLTYRPSDPRKRKQTETKIAVFLLILPPHDKACGTERWELNGSTGEDARALGDLRSGCRVIFGTPSCQRPEGQEMFIHCLVVMGVRSTDTLHPCRVPLQLESPHEKSSRAKVSLDGPMDTAFA
ncbi:hypothetical protein CSPX01_13459 [Colletotrichum filicis]|nr:hypothetical protein CSPX01_13459 [Colletotrichum filicis]